MRALLNWFKKPPAVPRPVGPLVLLHLCGGDELQIGEVETHGKFKFVRMNGYLVRLNPDGSCTGRTYVNKWEALD